MPSNKLKLACPSKSINKTRFPNSDNDTPKFKQVDVFATPPFWLQMAITFLGFSNDCFNSTTSSLGERSIEKICLHFEHLTLRSGLAIRWSSN